MLIRLQKYLADCGLASRRKAESIIVAGQIKVNKEIITSLGSKVDPQQDQVFYQDKLIQPQKFIYILLNKPLGYTCTTKNFSQEKNILQLVTVKEKIFPVGRLDKNTSGLILLTNDGDFSYKLTHPKFEIEKEYQILIKNKINKDDLEKMKNGIRDEDDILQIKNYKIITPNLINLVLTQGHKREIRRLCQIFHYPLLELKRIRFDHWQLGDLATGQWRYFQP